MELSERLKTARKQNSYTQEEVATILNISRTTVSSWEVGRTIPSLNYVIDISNLYNISLDILLKEDISVREQVNKDLKLKNIYKKIVIVVTFLLSIFGLINIGWGLKIRSDYKNVVENFEKNQNLYTLNQNNVDYSIMKPKYLSFHDNKELVARTKDNNFEWIFSNNENYGKIYVKFSDGGESSLMINSKLRFDEKANKEIGLSFSKDEQKDIDNYLNENQKELQNSYNNAQKIWNEIQ